MHVTVATMSGYTISQASSCEQKSEGQRNAGLDLIDNITHATIINVGKGDGDTVQKCCQSKLDQRRRWCL